MMTGLSNARVAVAVARAVDRFVDRFDCAALDEGRRRDALREIAGIRGSLGNKSVLIDSALAKLERALSDGAKSPARPNPRATRSLARLIRALVPLTMAGATLTSFVATPAMADVTVPAIGADIVDPKTGDTEHVAQILDGYAVITDQNHFILLAQTVDDTFTVIDHSVATVPPPSTDYKVTDVTETDGRVTQVTIENLTTHATSTMDTSAVYSGPPDIGGGTGPGFGSPPSTMAGPYPDIRGGGDGGDGRKGGGVCFGALGCVEYSPGDGGNGGTLDAFSDTISAARGEIDTSAANSPGIVVVSKGGEGGDGGTGYGNIPPAHGGNGGDGGTVTATNETTVVTQGANSYGMLVQSVGGRSGSGGNCYIACSGGGPGTPGDGGSATGINNGSITTGGDDAVGLIVQSSGGNSGTGGDSYGIVGDAGGGGYGGNGGEAHAVNNSYIHTTGQRAYGVLAQSIGGIGGNSGNSAGIVAWSADAGSGGHGGHAWAELGADSITTTTGDWAHAVFAQSIGGGGGSSGWSGGAASFGASGGSGGYGGNVDVDAAAGAYIETHGTGAYGIFAESVGGSGGTAGGTGGAFTMGGTGGSGNIGGDVTVNSSATIITHGMDARGIFAQSVGGGGGSANASGGVVSLGGSGGSGSDGGVVKVVLGSDSSITTRASAPTVCSRSRSAAVAARARPRAG